MKRHLFILMMSCIACTISAQTGWQSLFNGKNLKGWKVIGGKAEYKVVDGTIVGTSRMDTPNTFLATEKCYGDFILEMEFKVDDEKKSIKTDGYMDINMRSIRHHVHGAVVFMMKPDWGGYIL